MTLSFKESWTVKSIPVKFHFDGKEVTESEYHKLKFCLCGNLNMPRKLVCKQCSTTTKKNINMKTIYKDANGVEVTAQSVSDNGTTIPSNVDGHYYHIQTGKSDQFIKFQLGPVPANGVNGLTNEALLAVLIHRTKLLDSKFACDENKRAISHMEEALVNLEVRTARRMVRGVEGKEVL